MFLVLKISIYYSWLSVYNLEYNACNISQSTLKTNGLVNCSNTVQGITKCIEDSWSEPFSCHFINISEVLDHSSPFLWHFLIPFLS